MLKKGKVVNVDVFGALGVGRGNVAGAVGEDIVWRMLKEVGNSWL